MQALDLTDVWVEFFIIPENAVLAKPIENTVETILVVVR
jgi:hypothetical protein